MIFFYVVFDIGYKDRFSASPLPVYKDGVVDPAAGDLFFLILRDILQKIPLRIKQRIQFIIQLPLKEAFFGINDVVLFYQININTGIGPRLLDSHCIDPSMYYAFIYGAV